MKMPAHAMADHAPASTPRQAELTQARAGAVANQFVERGLPYDRLTVRWWSSDVAAKASWSATEAARVDLFFTVDGLEFPLRPAHYQFSYLELSPAE